MSGHEETAMIAIAVIIPVSAAGTSPSRTKAGTDSWTFLQRRSKAREGGIYLVQSFSGFCLLYVVHPLIVIWVILWFTSSDGECMYNWNKRKHDTRVIHTNK